MTAPSKTLEDAIKQGLRNARWESSTGDDGLVQSIATEINNMDGRASNEGEKAARRKVAVDSMAILFIFAGRDLNDEVSKVVDAIIETAQG